jgi:coproporphyrinogen III oxidase
MSNNLPYVIKQIMKLYYVDTITYVNEKRNYISITVHVIFSPKEVNPITPEVIKSYGVVDYYKDHKEIGERFLFGNNQMPILSYITDTTSLDNFLDEVVEKAADEKYDEVKKYY